MSTPRHVGIIMDGNRRWAKEHGLPTLRGHRRGYDKLKEVGEWCLDRGVEILTVYAFSMENWKRSAEEVKYLMALVLRALTKEIDEYRRRGIRVRVIGRRDSLPDPVRRAADSIWEKTKEGSRGLLQLAINYSGQVEIVDAVRALMLRGMGAGGVTEETIAAHLYSPEVQPPDLIIRTSGEQRLSGFLTWQSAYSELYFLKKHWPDFSQTDLDEALTWYAARERRFGT